MFRYEGPKTAFTIALHRGLYLAIIKNRYEWSHTSLTICLYRDLHFEIMIDHYEVPLIALTKPCIEDLLSHYNGPL
jgi:hypothetical protein